MSSSPSTRNRPKILFVCHTFPPYHFAGAQLFALNLAQALVDNGCDVRVFYPVNLTALDPSHAARPYTLMTSRYQDLPVYQLIVDDTRKELETHPQYVFRHGATEAAFEALLEQEQFELVHFHLLFRLSCELPLIARRRQIPTVATLHDYWLLCAMGHLIDTLGRDCQGPASVATCAQCLRNFSGPPAASDVDFISRRQQATAAALAATDAIFSPSGWLADIHARYGFKRPAILPLGWLPLQAQPKVLDAQKIIFGYAGQIIPRKGLDILVAALQRLSLFNWELHIYGEKYAPALFDKIQEQIQGDARFRYCGPYRPEDLSRIYSTLDVAVMPSRRENYPLTLLEALSARVPVIASDVGGVRDILQPYREGFIFPAGDIPALQTLLQLLLRNPHLIPALRAAIRPIKTIADNAREYLAVYQSLGVGGNESMG